MNSEEEKKSGVVVYLNEAKGYGFIEISGYNKNIFFHARDMRDATFAQVRRGDQVKVEKVLPTEKGFNARGVSMV